MEIESRVSTLEEKARAQAEIIHTLTGKLDLIAAGVSRLETASALAVARACPAPGKCLELAESIARMQIEAETTKGGLKELQTAAAEARGGWKVLALVAGAAGAIGSLFGWAMDHFSKGGKP